MALPFYIHIFSVADYIWIVNKTSTINTERAKGQHGYKIKQVMESIDG